MKLSQLFSAALVIATASAKALDSFAKGGTLPENQILYGAMKGKSGASGVKRAASTTSLVSDSHCTNGPTTRNCWLPGYTVANDFDVSWPTTGVTRQVCLHPSLTSRPRLTYRYLVHIDNHQYYLQP